jgi:hypothetical protein
LSFFNLSSALEFFYTTMGTKRLQSGLIGRLMGG